MKNGESWNADIEWRYGVSAASAIMGDSSNSPWGGDKTLTGATAAAAEEVMTAVWSRTICNNGAGRDRRGRNCDLLQAEIRYRKPRASPENAYSMAIRDALIT